MALRRLALCPSLSRAGALAALALLIGGGAPPDRAARQVALLNRISWGASPSSIAALDGHGASALIDAQLRMPANAPLPVAAQAQIDAMEISGTPMATLVVNLDAENRAARALTDPDQKKAAIVAYNKHIQGLETQAATRSILRDLYSPAQLREQMTWFWFNQFNVQAAKADIRAMVGDYEDQAIRVHALGRYRDLLEATLRHPAMLRYLDNSQNSAGHINENYAREIMELHSMGVGSGYTQKDVQELARILTGVGVDLKPDPPKLKPAQQPLLVREGLFEFNPARHDFGDKMFLGQKIKGSGFAEVEQALDLIAASPATARRISERLAIFFVGDAPPAALVDRMAATFRRSHGDIAAVLRTLFRSREFDASLGTAFKDPIHYAVSAVRLVHDDRVIANSAPILGWLRRMGEGLYARETPDGYPLTSAAWIGPGQLSVRFEIARQIGGSPAGLFNAPVAGATDQPAFPRLQNALQVKGLHDRLSAPTRTALDQAASPNEWNSLFLSSPEFMRR